MMIDRALHSSLKRSDKSTPTRGVQSLLKLSAPLLVMGLSGAFVGCDKPERCTVNSECGNQHLCREGVCKPKCETYLTCDEGEACVDGACEVPSADYCSHVVPAQTPPEMGAYEPCPPSEVNVAGEMSAMMTPGGMPAASGGMSAPASEGGASAGASAPAGAEQVAGEGAMGGESAGAEAPAGESAGAEASAGESAGAEAPAGESAGAEMMTAGAVIEVVGGQAE